jgi:hypothetical protein
VAIIAGWGRGTWSEGSWGEPLPVEVTGEQLSTAQGTVVVSANADVLVTGEQLTTADGTVAVSASANIPITGEQLTIAQGTVVVSANADAPVTGEQLSTAQGTVVAVADAIVSATGVQAISNPDPRGASDKRFVAFDTQVVRAIYPNTDVYVDGSFSTTLVNVGDTTTVTVSAASSKTIITDRAVSIAGGASLSAAPFSWAGTRFSTRITRNNDSKISVEAVSGLTTVRIYKGNDTSPTFTLTTSPGSPAFANSLFGTYGAQTWSIEADSPIVCASSAISFRNDTDVLYPESTELFGHGGILTSTSARNNATGFTITTFLSQLGTTESDTISSTNLSPTTTGRGSQYTLGNYTRSTAAEPFALRVVADGDGGETTNAVSPEALATNFTLPDTAEFLAIVAPAEADGKNIRLYDASGSLLYTATFSQVPGAVAGTPCALYLLNTTIGVTLSAGTQIESDYPCFIVWEDDGTEDETILYGYGSFDNPIAGSSAIADANVSPTGVSATTTVGTATVEADANVLVTGVSATATVGTVAVKADADFSVTGASATSTAGTATIEADAVASVTGVEVTGAAGTVVVTGTAVVSPTGAEATLSLGSVIVSADADAPITA